MNRTSRAIATLLALALPLGAATAAVARDRTPLPAKRPLTAKQLHARAEAAKPLPNASKQTAQASPKPDPNLPKTVELGAPPPQAKPPRPIAPQTPPPARSGRGAFAQHSGPVAVAPIPQTATAATATIKPDMKSPTPLPAAKPAAKPVAAKPAAKPAPKPAQAKPDRRAALTGSQKQTGGR